jgi:hypothetical protein
MERFLRAAPASTSRRKAMSFETSGADYLRRLKQDEIQQPRSYIEPAGVAAPADTDETQPERRRNPRYKCEGSAAFRVQGSTVRTWGTFTDLSISGCYVELKATFPVGAIIDLELELNGCRTLVKGEVRVSYPFLGMGVAFRDITAENRSQIDAMIETVRPTVTPKVSNVERNKETHPSSMPIILNPGAALQALADFFDGQPLLSKDEFIHLLRKSQGL